ncbi:MAG: hypothetical protein K0S23_2380 [Fluviicola sp.]|uniref:hypothetical protein n=1 Tax=Fluviicola sp. TaxID=1917219 RepID=UPI0026210C74|nr:hypothetical protein [Fluviicola sp.]MDF3028073.1 hypothetical protein [Fluviicola sp.]
MRLLFIIVVLPGFAFLTKDRVATADEFKEWYKTNYQSLVFSTDYENLNYQMRYNPAELRLLGAISRNEVNNKAEIKQWYKENDTYEEFSFKITSKAGRDLFVEYSETKEEINEKVFYFVESAKYDFLLVREKDTIAPVHYQFENTYGVAPFVTIYLAFDKSPKDNGVKELIFKDQVLNNAVIPFEIKNLNNLNIPKITQL